MSKLKNNTEKELGLKIEKTNLINLCDVKFEIFEKGNWVQICKGGTKTGHPLKD